MARPTQNTIDYFSHDCQHKQTMYILESRYKNDGYAFWFKLLESLGSAPNHFLDLNDEIACEFLAAKTNLSWSSCDEMLTLLAKINAICPNLWAKKIVWCQKFVDRLSGVYAKRKRQIPNKPSFCDGNDSITVFSDTETPQSKVKESKVKESKVKESKKDHVATSCDASVKTKKSVNNTVIEKDNAYISEYELNKDCASWKPLSKKITLSKKIINVIEKDNLPLSKKIPTKETITKEIKERKESEILPSDYYQKTLKALGLPSTGIISPKDHSVLVALLKDNCNFDDIEQARIKRKKNRLEWIQDSVCEMRDARLATVAKPDENGIPILPSGHMDWDNMTFEQKQFAIQRGYEK